MKTAVTLKLIDSLISGVKTVIARFYLHYDNLTREFNSKLPDDLRRLEWYKETVDRANEWAKNVRMTRSFVSVESCKYLRQLHGMIDRITLEMLTDPGRNGIYPEVKKEDGDA